MKTLLLSNTDILDGASRAAYRLHQGLCKINISSQMLVQIKASNDSAVIGPDSQFQKGLARLRPSLDALPLRLYSGWSGASYSTQWLPNQILSELHRLQPDIISLHHMCRGYLPIGALQKFKAPIVWTLHDMWPFTGGCHYSQGCDLYLQNCGNCPQLQSHQSWDLSRWIWQRKAKYWKDLNLTIVTPSRWLAGCAKESALFRDLRVEVIPNGINTHVYCPLEKHVAKDLLGLSTDKKIILFGAAGAGARDPRKGFHLLLPALEKLNQEKALENIELAVFGKADSASLAHLNFKVHYLGQLNDDISLRLLYAAADVFVAPSIEDNLPNTVMEALACGTPCVAYNIGGMADMIEPQQNGYLAEPLSIEDLAQGLIWILEDDQRHHYLCSRAHQKVEKEFSQEIQAQRYLSLFQEVIGSPPRAA